jgi:hypothetical protein
MTTLSTETQIALLVEGQRALQRELEEVQAEGIIERAAMSAKIAALEDERNKALKWGVLTLGSALISLVAWIGNKVIEGHIK